MDVYMSLALVLFIIFVIYKFIGKSNPVDNTVETMRNNSLLRLFNANHINAIIDQFTTMDEVSKAIRQAGLESSNLIFGIDYTVSNRHQGEKSFGGLSLHSLSVDVENPYQQVIRILGNVLTPFDDDGIIPAFGFGDVSTKDKSVFPFRAEKVGEWGTSDFLVQIFAVCDATEGVGLFGTLSHCKLNGYEQSSYRKGYCHGFQDVLNVYTQLTPNVILSGPTNFAPLIYQAIEIVKQTRSYHILVIVADGQVTSERLTRDAIVEAARWPLSIVMVGVGDGPWETMHQFDDRLPQRQFDNFQFVNFNKVLTFAAGNPDQTFALHALMEIPDQYKTIRQLGLLDF